MKTKHLFIALIALLVSGILYAQPSDDITGKYIRLSKKPITRAEYSSDKWYVFKSITGKVLSKNGTLNPEGKIADPYYMVYNGVKTANNLVLAGMEGNYGSGWIDISKNKTYRALGMNWASNDSDMIFFDISTKTSSGSITYTAISSGSVSHSDLYSSRFPYVYCWMAYEVEFVDLSDIAISFGKESYTMYVGNQKQLDIETTLNQSDATWSSTNTSIATVDNKGNVTAMAVGETTITVTIGDVTASCQVSVIEQPTSGALTDDDVSYNTTTTVVDDLSYTRTFSNTNWQALYLPFSLEYSDWSTNFDMARINDLHQFDDDDDGIMEVTALEVANLKAGSHTEPNTPYLIRAKATGTYTFIPTNKTLFPAEENSFEVTSWNNTFTFTGTYSGLSGTEMVANNYYAMGGGTLKRATDTAYGLAPYRWYMEVADRYGNPVNLGEVKVMCLDDEWEETGINNVNDNLNNEDAVYDLSGRKISHSLNSSFSHSLPKGIYIKNGKKVFVK